MHPEQAAPKHPAVRIVEANEEIKQTEREIDRLNTRLTNAKIELEKATGALAFEYGLRHGQEKLFHLKSKGAVVRVRASTLHPSGAGEPKVSVDVLSLEEVKGA